MESQDFAWAAGFFDGEGWANRQRRGVNSRINQTGPDGIPEVLIKFQRIVGVGRIHGPVIIEGRQPLYYWDATSRPDLVQIVERTLATPLPPMVWPGSMSEELAWAGGFFDGEGSTYLEKHRTHPDYFYPVLYVPQSADIGVAPELLRLLSAVNGIGRISGIRRDGPDWRPYRRWRVVTALKVQAVLHLLWPFIGDVKRSQARHVMETIHSQPDLPRGNPAFGAAGARFCLRGHDKWNARIRPFKGRGKNEEDPLNHLRQCLACVREDAKARRNRKRRPQGRR